MKPIPILLVATALLLACGCSQQAKKQRSLDRAGHYFDDGHYDKAVIEYLNVLRIEQTNSVAIQRLGIAYYEQGDLGRAYPFLLEASRVQPENIEVRERLGIVYLAAREHVRAQETAEWILARNPTHQTALLLIGDAVRTQEEIARSRQFLERIKESAGGQAAYHLALANLHMKSQQNEDAERALKRAQQLDPNSALVLRALGNFHLSRNDLGSAGEFFASAAQDTPLQSDERMRLIDFKVRTGDIAEAKRMLEEIEKAAPDYFPALLFRARISLAEQQFDECLDYIQKVLRRDRFNLEARLLEARVAMAQGNTAKAREGLENLRTRLPDIPAIHFHLALAFLAENEPTRAATRLSEAIRLNPKFDEAILLLAQLDIRRGNIAPAVTSLQQLIAREPGHLQAQLLLAMAYRVRGTAGDAIALYQELMKQRPEDAQIPYLLGTTYRQQNQNAQAREMFQRTAELSPDSLLAIGQLVELDIIESRFADSLKRLEAKLAEHPEAPWPRFLLGQVYLAQTNHIQAEKLLLETIERSADFRPAYLMLAQVYVRSGRAEEALAKLDQTLANNPQDAVALMQKATVLQEAKRYAEAAEVYERLIELAPNAGAALNNLAYIYSEHLDGINRAHDLATRARAVLADSPHAADTLGWIFFKRKEYERALPLLRESAEKLPTEPEVLFHLGSLYYAQGEAAQARATFQQALDLKKEFPHEPVIRQKLSVLNLNPAQISREDLEKVAGEFSRDPTDVILGLKLGEAHQVAGQKNQAAQIYEQLLNTHPRLVPAMFNLARLYAEDPARAKTAFDLAQTLRTLAPSDSRVTHLLGKLAYERGEHKWSLSLLQESANRLRDDAEAQFDLGRALLANGQLAAAQTSFERTLVLNPEFSKAGQTRRLVDLLSFYQKLPAARNERGQIQPVIEAAADSLPALLVIGRLHDLDGQQAQAQAVFDRILTRFPEFAPASKYLARLHADSGGDLNRAYDLAMRARETLQGDADLAKTFGKIVYLRGDFKYAAFLLQECSRLMPQDAEVFYYLGMAQFRLNQKVESKNSLERALALNPNAPFLADARQVLGQISAEP